MQFFYGQMSETSAAKLKHKRKENWKPLSIKFETHKYNTEFISGKMFDIEMAALLNLILRFLCLWCEIAREKWCKGLNLESLEHADTR